MGRWQLPHFLKAIKLAVTWAIDNGAVYDLLLHPSCSGVVDPKCETVELICDLVAQAKDRAAIVQPADHRVARERAAGYQDLVSRARSFTRCLVSVAALTLTNA